MAKPDVRFWPKRKNNGKWGVWDNDANHWSAGLEYGEKYKAAFKAANMNKTHPRLKDDD